MLVVKLRNAMAGQSSFPSISAFPGSCSWEEYHDLVWTARRPKGFRPFRLVTTEQVLHLQAEESLLPGIAKIKASLSWDLQKFVLTNETRFKDPNVGSQMPQVLRHFILSYCVCPSECFRSYHYQQNLHSRVYST
jgi:hypothetical protein